MPKGEKTCPECGQPLAGNGFDGIDAHWKSAHENIMPYKEAWPLIKSGSYQRSSGLKETPPVQYTDAQRKEYERLMALGIKKGIFK